MAIFPTHLFTLTLSCIAISLFHGISTAELESDLVSDLLTLQSQSKSGVIRLNDESVIKFITSTKTPRPYFLLIFFDAAQLHDKPELSYEFAVVASSFTTNHNHSNTKLFFCDIEFSESQSLFHLFDVKSLPNVQLVRPAAKSMKDESEEIRETSSSQSLVQFIESRTKLTVGPIHYPPLVSRNQVGLIVGLLLIYSPFAVKKLLTGETLFHDPRIWLSGTIFVYFFSVSGAMHNIIRQMPMFLKDSDDPNKLIFFYQGSGIQLGLEGFSVGFLYTIVGLLLALVTHVLVYVQDSKTKNVAMLFFIFISFLAVKQVIFLDNWKTGYAIHGFWPSGWN